KSASTPIDADKPLLKDSDGEDVDVHTYRVGKGFSGVETPLFESMLVVRDVAEEAEAQEKDAEFKGRHVDNQAEIYNIDLDHSSKVLSMQEDDTEESYKNIDWNAALAHVQSKEPQYIKRYHGMKKKPQTKSEACKNMIFYLKNTEGYKMDFFKGEKYDEILPIFQTKFDANMRFLFKSREEMEAEDEEIIKSINETPAQKAAMRRKLSEEAQEAEDLRKRLEII
nr:hypothetical protein [Tanacetum cinerariifolium]